MGGPARVLESQWAAGMECAQLGLVRDAVRDQRDQQDDRALQHSESGRHHLQPVCRPAHLWAACQLPPVGQRGEAEAGAAARAPAFLYRHGGWMASAAGAGVSDHQAAKAVVSGFYEELDGGDGRALGPVISRHVAPDYRFRGVHPFNELAGAEAVAGVLWEPLRHALTSLQRRQDVFMAGTSETDGQVWVFSMGHLMGL